MGKAGPHRISIAAWRARAGPVWLMIAEGWRVWADCRRCGQRRAVDLVAIGKKLGPDYCLWDRAPRCRTPGCRELLILEARPGGFEITVHLCDPGLWAEKSAARRQTP